MLGTALGRCRGGKMGQSTRLFGNDEARKYNRSCREKCFVSNKAKIRESTFCIFFTLTGGDVSHHAIAETYVAVMITKSRPF